MLAMGTWQCEKNLLTMAAFIPEFIRNILAGVERALLVQHPAGAGCHPCWLSPPSLVCGHWKLWEKPDVGWE